MQVVFIGFGGLTSSNKKDKGLIISTNITKIDTPPTPLMDSIVSLKGENIGRIRSWGMLLGL
jgi:hypothetical protein